MPLFEYECADCGRRFEAFVTASRQVTCPTCQSDRLEKLVSRLGRIGGGTSDALPAFTGG